MRCSVCGEEISPDRLAAEPSARLCLDCKKEFEEEANHPIPPRYQFPKPSLKKLDAMVRAVIEVNAKRGKSLRREEIRRRLLNEPGWWDQLRRDPEIASVYNKYAGGPSILDFF